MNFYLFIYFNVGGTRTMKKIFIPDNGTLDNYLSKHFNELD